MIEPITPRDFEESDGVGEWRVLGEGACTFYRTGSFQPRMRIRVIGSPQCVFSTMISS